MRPRSRIVRTFRVAIVSILISFRSFEEDFTLCHTIVPRLVNITFFFFAILIFRFLFVAKNNKNLTEVHVCDHAAAAAATAPTRLSETSIEHCKIILTIKNCLIRTSVWSNHLNVLNRSRKLIFEWLRPETVPTWVLYMLPCNQFTLSVATGLLFIGIRC